MMVLRAVSLVIAIVACCQHLAFAQRTSAAGYGTAGAARTSNGGLARSRFGPFAAEVREREHQHPATAAQAESAAPAFRGDPRVQHSGVRRAGFEQFDDRPAHAASPIPSTAGGRRGWGQPASYSPVVGPHQAHGEAVYLDGPTQWLAGPGLAGPGPAGPAGAGGCTDCGGDVGYGAYDSCGDCGACNDCRTPWRGRWTVFGKYLLLRSRDLDVAFASEVNGPPAVPIQGIQTAPIGVVDQDYESGYAVGFTSILDSCSYLSATYTKFDGSSNQAVERSGTNTIRALVLHPLTLNAISDFTTATASQNVEFELVDAEYHMNWIACDDYTVGFFIGARYAQLDQDFSAQFTLLGTSQVQTELDFEGGGLRTGLDFEHHAGCSGFFVYGEGAASFIAGEFTGSYLQGSDLAPVEVQTQWRAGKVVSILELELGVGWTSRGGNFRITGGYQVSAWFNAVATDEFITAVQTNNFDDLGEPLTFDGLAVMGELKF